MKVLTYRLYIIALFILPILTACAQVKQKTEQAPSASLILLHNEGQTIPFADLDHQQFFYLNLCKDDHLSLLPQLAKYDSVASITLEDAHNYTEKKGNTFIVSIDQDNINRKTLDKLSILTKNNSLVLAVFADFSYLNQFDKTSLPTIWTNDTRPESASQVASALFGGTTIKDKLPIDINEHYFAGMGFSTEKTRLGYGKPEAEGIDGTLMTDSIDQIVQEGISARAFPGAVVLVARNGNVIFEKAYGYHTYDKQVATKVDDLFDMASVTKIAATTLEVMHLTEEGKINLDETMGTYLPDIRKNYQDKANVKLRDVMLHQAGFIPFIPFYKNLQPKDTSRDSSSAYPTKLADGIYIRKGYFQDVMWKQMMESPLKTQGEYVYSDISMYVMKAVIEQVTHQALNELVKKDFYKPLGMYHSTFQPRLFFPKGKIVPTENDQEFRKTLLQGYVHDQGAAMVDGVSGHAGLFSTASDLAKYGQLLLNKGTYGGQRYLKPETIDAFTSRYSAVSRRGLGFDRWDPDTTKHYPSQFASPATFGHTGYTGTCIWIDPVNQLTYIFLSNRVHPEVSTKLLQMNIRSRIEDAIYLAMRGKTSGQAN
ncbi:serine hydrolase domain-containing protein [Olivibacter sitiensis]|uniref:serine hydrolase domain-containing protein n=1 Tax=Olivibacter sitiensis TaxID=376470 RepID=UPI0004099C16|nr:serine hydrolase [Olivibacter sitiensis]